MPCTRVAQTCCSTMSRRPSSPAILDHTSVSSSGAQAKSSFSSTLPKAFRRASAPRCAAIAETRAAGRQVTQRICCCSPRAWRASHSTRGSTAPLVGRRNASIAQASAKLARPRPGHAPNAWPPPPPLPPPPPPHGHPLPRHPPQPHPPPRPLPPHHLPPLLQRMKTMTQRRQRPSWQRKRRHGPSRQTTWTLANPLLASEPLGAT